MKQKNSEIGKKVLTDRLDQRTSKYQLTHVKKYHKCCCCDVIKRRSYFIKALGQLLHAVGPCLHPIKNDQKTNEKLLTLVFYY